MMSMRCYWCGNRAIAGTGRPTLDYNGERYEFCSTDCLQAWLIKHRGLGETANESN